VEIVERGAAISKTISVIQIIKYLKGVERL